MSSAPRYPIPPQTVDDYRHWQGDWELVEGIPIAMSPSPFGPHKRLVDDIADALKHQMQIGRCPVGSIEIWTGSLANKTWSGPI